jgi:hypothetical protein
VKHERELARVLDVRPPEAYERSAESKRSWWRRAFDLFGTFRRKHGDTLAREDIAEYHRQKEREELPITAPERHLGLRVARLEDMAKAWSSMETANATISAIAPKSQNRAARPTAGIRS